MTGKESKKSRASWMTGKEYISRLARSAKKKIKQKVLLRKRFLRVW
jgi:hypothetical protein